LYPLLQGSRNNPFPAKNSLSLLQKKKKAGDFILLKHLLFVLFNLAGNNLHRFNAVGRDCEVPLSVRPLVCHLSRWERQGRFPVCFSWLSLWESCQLKVD